MSVPFVSLAVLIESLGSGTLPWRRKMEKGTGHGVELVCDVGDDDMIGSGETVRVLIALPQHLCFRSHIFLRQWNDAFEALWRIPDDSGGILLSSLLSGVPCHMLFAKVVTQRSRSRRNVRGAMHVVKRSAKDFLNS